MKNQKTPLEATETTKDAIMDTTPRKNQHSSISEAKEGFSDKELPAQQLDQLSVQNMIMTAISSGASVEALEKLFSLQERWEKSQAKKAFDLAMTNFQSEMPEIKKTRTIMNRDGKTVRSRYASLDDAQKTAKPYLKKNQLSYKFETIIDKDFLTAVCVVKHALGHTEKSEFKVPIGSEDFMSDVQKFGARATFAKRYAFSGAFGITMDDDNDAQDTGRAEDSKIREAIKKLEECKNAREFNELVESFPKEIKSNKDVLKKALEIKNLIQNLK